MTKSTARMILFNLEVIRKLKGMKKRKRAAELLIFIEGYCEGVNER
jgi:hypothetical protein